MAEETPVTITSPTAAQAGSTETVARPDLPPASAPLAGAGDTAEFEPVDTAMLQATLDYIRPALQADGGDLILLGVDDGVVSLEMVGACGGCPMSVMTLKAGIERILTDRVPGVREVIAS